MHEVNVEYVTSLAGTQIIQTESGDRLVIPIRENSRDPALYEYSQSQYIPVPNQESIVDHQALGVIQVNVPMRPAVAFSGLRFHGALCFTDR